MVSKSKVKTKPKTITKSKSKTKLKTITKSKSKSSDKSVSKPKPSFFQRNKKTIIGVGSVLGLYTATTIGIQYKLKSELYNKIREGLKDGYALEKAKENAVFHMYTKYKGDDYVALVVKKYLSEYKE